MGKVVEAKKWLDQWQQSGAMQSSRPEQLIFQSIQSEFNSAPDLGLKDLLELMQYEAFPDYWNYDIGGIYKYIGDFENSVFFLKEFMDIGLTPRNIGIYTELNDIYNILGKWDEALHALKVGLERNPTRRRLMGSMIRQHLMLGDMEKANEWFAKYKAISKRAAVGSGVVYIVYGDHYVLLGDYVKADENYTKALSDIDLSAWEIRYIAGAYVGMKKIARAQEILLDAEKRYPNNIHIIRHLSYLYRTKQEYEKAIEHGEKATTLDPSHDLSLRLAKALFHVANGESLQAKAEWDSLISQYKKPLNAPSTHPFNYYRLGYIFALRGDVEAALQMLESAFEKGYRAHSNFLYDPDLDNVRNDPSTKEGFAALLEKVKASYPAIARNKGAEK